MNPSARRLLGLILTVLGVMAALALMSGALDEWLGIPGDPTVQGCRAES